MNAVRGTEYTEPVGRALDNQTVELAVQQQDDEYREEPLPFNPRLILGNLVVTDPQWEGAATRTPGSPFGAPILSFNRLSNLATVLAKSERAVRRKIGRRHPSSAVLVLPELSVPRAWLRAVGNHVVHFGGFALVAGLEYLHHGAKPYVLNQAVAVLPGPFMAVATWPWTKRLPAREEAMQLATLPSRVAFPPRLRTDIMRPRPVIVAPWGRFSVLICSELIEARRVADLLGRVELVLGPSWNTDTASYDHLIQSAGLQLHAIMAIANNGYYSDCRAWAPKRERWRRDLCRLIERDVDDVVFVDLPIQSLRNFHRSAPLAVAKPGSGEQPEWKPLPPDWPTPNGTNGV